MAIAFNYESANFRVRNSNKIKSWLEEVIKKEGFSLGDLNFIFAGDSYITAINKEFLEHDWATDVIAFADNENNILGGEIYIGVYTVKYNALKYKTSFRDELHRVMVHGVLHLASYDDKSEEEIRIIREKENYYLDRRDDF